MSSSRVNLEKYLIPLEEINRATQNFSEERRIGDGGFGALYKGQLSERWEKCTAAIKRLSRDSYQGEREFYNELEMISRFQHENIISFMGYCDEEGEMIIVYHYAMNGSLDQHLQDPDRMRCITWPQRLMICIGAAKGLNYLHSGLGEHRDIKSANILLDSNMVAKISDFGLSKLGPRNQPYTELYTKIAGTQFYLDPTYQESRILQKKSDVYSFGVVLFEILSGMLAYRERSIGDERQFLMHSVRRYHLKDPENIIDPHIIDEIDCLSFDIFKEIAFQCISFNLEERPSLDTVIKKMEEALTVQTSERSTSTPATSSTIEILMRRLKSGSSYYQRTASHEIRLLLEVNADNCIIVAKAGAIPLLTDLLRVPDSRTQEHAMTALVSLTSNENNDNIMSSLPDIVHVLNEGNMKAQENAAAILCHLSIKDKNRAAIGAVGAIPPLLLQLSEGSLTGKVWALNALLYLYSYEGNITRMVSADVVPILIESLKEPLIEMQEIVLKFLNIISCRPEGNVAIGNAEVVPYLVEVIGTRSLKGKENAAKVLVALGSRDQKYFLEAQEHGVTGKLVDMLQHGTNSEKSAALDLLKKMFMVQDPR